MRYQRLLWVVLVATNPSCTSSTAPAHPATPILFLSVDQPNPGLWLTSTDGGWLVPGPRGEGFGYADWAPDGRRIVVEGDSGNWIPLKVVPIDGSEPPLQITHGPGHCLSPRWSPDGSRISYWSWDGGDSAMTVVINSDGTNPRSIIATKIAQSGYNAHVAAWSPDGNTIAFTKDGDLFTLRLDGSAPLRVTIAERAAQPEWSPDGSRIAVEDGNGGIAIVSVGNSAITRLDQTNADMTPDWSPDGASIVFASRRNGLVHIYIMKSDGTGVVDLMPRQLSDNYRPRWNPTAR